MRPKMLRPSLGEKETNFLGNWRKKKAKKKFGVREEKKNKHTHTHAHQSDHGWSSLSMLVYLS